MKSKILFLITLCIIFFTACTKNYDLNIKGKLVIYRDDRGVEVTIYTMNNDVYPIYKSSDLSNPRTNPINLELNAGNYKLAGWISQGYNYLPKGFQVIQNKTTIIKYTKDSNILVEYQ